MKYFLGILLGFCIILLWGACSSNGHTREKALSEHHRQEQQQETTKQDAGTLEQKPDSMLRESKPDQMVVTGGLKCDPRTFPPYKGSSPKPGGKLPLHLAEQIKKLLPQWRTLLNKKDLPSLHMLMCKIRGILGPWQGIEEIAHRHKKPINPKPPNLQELTNATVKTVQRYVGREQWTEAKGRTNGNAITGALRRSCKEIRLYIETSKLTPQYKTRYISLAQKGLEYLLQVQHGSGVFPFPDLSDEYTKLKLDCQNATGKKAQGCKRLLATHLGGLLHKIKTRMKRDGIDSTKYFKNGWYIEDAYAKEDGGLMFDNGVCGSTMLYAYEQLKDKRYLKSAIKAGEWASRQPIVTNWNYNSFSAGLMAQLYRLTQEKRWLQAAIRWTEFGFLPGQMASNGRWFDPHNARLVYHVIMLDAIAELLRILPPEHRFYDRLQKSMILAINRSTKELSALGVLAAEDGLHVFSNIHRHSATSTDKKALATALHILANSGFLGSQRGINLLTMPAYILWRRKQ